MPVDPAARAVLDLLTAPGVPPLDELPVPEARAAYEQLAGLAGEPAEVAAVLETSADGVPVRLYRPEGDGPHPVLLWLHGGGWVVGSAAGYDAPARDLCARSGCLVVSPDYRLAPEHPFPAALDDALTVTRWIRSVGPELGADVTRAAIAGDSAGGNLAAVTANALPGAFQLQVLVYPAVDLTGSHPSVQENGEGYLLTAKAMAWFSGHYLGAADPRDPRVSPLFADDATLAAAPPTVVITAEFDPLRDEGEAYADRLRAAGVPVRHTRYAGMIHGFLPMRAMVPAADRALDEVADALRLTLC